MGLKLPKFVSCRKLISKFETILLSLRNSSEITIQSHCHRYMEFLRLCRSPNFEPPNPFEPESKFFTMGDLVDYIELIMVLLRGILGV